MQQCIGMKCDVDNGVASFGSCVVLYLTWMNMVYIMCVLFLFCFYATVLDVEAFERLLGPCMNIMKRNIDDYEDQLVRIFGSKTNITDIRWKHYIGSYIPECTYFHTVLIPLLFILSSDMSFSINMWQWRLFIMVVDASMSDVSWTLLPICMCKHCPSFILGHWKLHANLNAHSITFSLMWLTMCLQVGSV